jgi:hypothetical protein
MTEKNLENMNPRELFEHFTEDLAHIMRGVATDACLGIVRPEDLVYAKLMIGGLLGAATDLHKTGEFTPQPSADHELDDDQFDEIRMLCRHLTSDGKATLLGETYALDELQMRYVAACAGRGFTPEPEALQERKAGGKRRRK